MARQTLEAWIPEEYGSAVLRRIDQTSVIEQWARREPMRTDTKHIPRTIGMGVSLIAKGAAYPEDQSPMDDILLTVNKFGQVVRLAEEDLDDAPEDVLNIKRLEWGTSYAVAIDNASLAATGTTPWASIYKQVRTTDATVSYTADTNYRTLSAASLAGTGAGAKALPYSAFSNLLGISETGRFYDPSDLVLMAAPAFRAIWRNAMTDQGQPIMSVGPNGQEEVFGVPVKWSMGARVSNGFSAAPTGNPIAVLGPRSRMILGVRSGPESVIIPGRDGASALTDETLLKMRARRAFNIHTPEAFAVLELVA